MCILCAVLEQIHPVRLSTAATRLAIARLQSSRPVLHLPVRQYRLRATYTAIPGVIQIAAQSVCSELRHATQLHVAQMASQQKKVLFTLCALLLSLLDAIIASSIHRVGKALESFHH